MNNFVLICQFYLLTSRKTLLLGDQTRVTTFVVGHLLHDLIYTRMAALSPNGGVLKVQF